MSNYAQLIRKFQGAKVLIVGDVMIDAYLSGTVSRMSPEAPVPVVSIEEEVYRLGGAANVALNILTLGAEPIICSVIGERKAERFFTLLRNRGFSEKGIIVSKTRKTTQKTRVIDQGKHLLRVDEEDVHDLSEDEENQLLDKLKDLIAEEKIDVVIFQDYNKGVLTEKVITEGIERSKAYNIPTAVDPKLNQFLSYKGVTLFKPNLKELREGLELEVDGSIEESVEQAMNTLASHLGNQISFVTLSEYGVAIKSADEFQKYEAHERDILDVSGAGDTVISVASLCLARGAGINQIAQLANLAGGLVCEKVGVVPISAEELILAAQSQLHASK
ncbi:MAG: bifunctional heptose 7-phosphate kinase/heptose 1-phosphate adenyltransferase [Flavobacteriales bacterium]